MPTNDWIIAVIVALTPVLTNILVYFAEKYSPVIPAWIKQLLTVALSQLVAYIGGLTATDPVIAALLSLAAVALHSIINEWGKASGLKAALFPSTK